MKMRIIISLLAIGLIFTIVDPAIAARPKSPQPKMPARHPPAAAVNNILFEKYELEVFDGSYMNVNWEKHRPIAPNVLDVNISLTMKKVPEEIWMRGVLYYKYTMYQKFLIDVSMELCAFLNGTVGNPVGEVIWQNYLKLQKNVVLNFKMQCPFNGTLNTLISPLNISDMNIPLMPAGRYRFDIHYSAHKCGTVVMIIRYFFSISDLRVWF